jgi:mono/diheme cytochrome c family protein
MRKKIAFFSGLAGCLLSLACALSLWPQTFGLAPEPPMLGNADPDSLRSALNRWRIRHERGGGAEFLRLPLIWSKALSSGPTQARGELSLNLLTGELHAQAQGLPEDRAYALWLVDNRPGPGRNMKPEAGDGLLKIGRLSPQGRLVARLEQAALAGFELDLAVIAPDGETPADGGLLFGVPGFLQRAYFAGQPWTQIALGGNALPSPAQDFAFLLPKPAYAHGTTTVDLTEQIAKGRELFVNETFGGNGRTCATCHRPDNNYTIDPAYIAELPPDDPLFVAERDPNLKDLENSALLRRFGLILANVDGFDKPPVLRAVPYLLGLAVSIMPEAVDFLGQAHTHETGEDEHDHEETAYDLNSNHMLGWSGDGSPGDGTLRMFAVGAIVQHAPKTLNRVAGIDYRLPTDEELDAIEAFMLSLGRSEDPILSKIAFSSALSEEGKKLFHARFDEGTGKCLGCHHNAGANSDLSGRDLNGNRETAVENMALDPSRVLAPEIAYDGGFGKTERHDCGPKRDQTCYGDGRFNITSLVEAADTPPYFHNHSVNTLEEAIAFYNSKAFNESGGALENDIPRQVNLDSGQIVAIAAFLRDLNVLENIRSSNKLDARAQTLSGKNAAETVRLAMADTQDTLEVFAQSHYNLHPEARTLLAEALNLEKKALNAAGAERGRLLAKAIAKKETARDAIAQIAE